jgi:transcriptional regulator with XRE-family HTH domain
MLRYRAIMPESVQENLEKIGATLRDARVAALLTQSEVGQQAGVSRQLISRIEQGINGEIQAYASVAAALQHRLAVVEETSLNDNTPAGLDFS